MAPPATDERWIELESKIAFQEHAIDELSAVVGGQERELAELRTRLERLEVFVRGGEAPPPGEGSG